MEKKLNVTDKKDVNTSDATSGEFCLFCDDDIRTDVPKASWKQKNQRSITVDNDRYNEALRYGFRILSEAHSYKAFCAAMTDFMGKDIIPCCDFIYKEIASSVPKKFARKLIDNGYSGECSEELIAAELQTIADMQKDTRSSAFESNTDELQFINIEYRNFPEFKKLIEFVGQHNFIDPYNALLLYMQKPDATFVFDGKTWAKEYERRPRRDAQKLIAVGEGGKVTLLFDFADTEMIPQQVNSLFNFDYELEDRWKIMTGKERKLNVDVEMRNLQSNLPAYGIFFDWTLKAHDSFIGFTDEYNDKELIINTSSGIIRYPSCYRISVNYRYPEEEAFNFICGELAALFLKEDMYGLRNVGERVMTVKEREFEKETVKWIVFRRLGLYYPMDDYLERYCTNGRIPICSTEHMMKAAGELERMLTSSVKLEDTVLYRDDKAFRATVDECVK